MYVPFLHLPRSFVFTGCESKALDFNTASDAAFSLAPSTEVGMIPNLPKQADFTKQVSGQCVGASTWTYAAVPQNLRDPWSMPGPCMFLFCVCHCPSYSLMRIQIEATFDATSAVSQPQLFGAPHWTGVAPLATYSVADTPEVSANASN